MRFICSCWRSLFYSFWWAPTWHLLRPSTAAAAVQWNRPSSTRRVQQKTVLNNSEWLHRFLMPYFDLFHQSPAPSQDQKQTQVQAENSVNKEPASPSPPPVEESAVLASSSRIGITDSCPTASSITPCLCSVSSATTLLIACSNQTLTDVTPQLSNINATTPVDSMNFAFN